MSNGPTGDWYDKQKKGDAILRVMRYIAANPAAGKNCIGNDTEAHKLFEDPKIGNIKIPQGGRVVIFDTGEEALEAGSSVIIELPPNPPPAPPKISAGWSDKELMTFVLGDYKYWGN
jgi:hypothetical protein